MIGKRVKHEKYGLGTIKNIMFEGRIREMYIVEFDASNSKFHDCMGLTKEKHGWFCGKKEVKILDECNRL